MRNRSAGAARGLGGCPLRHAALGGPGNRAGKGISPEGRRRQHQELPWNSLERRRRLEDDDHRRRGCHRTRGRLHLGDLLRGRLRAIGRWRDLRQRDHDENPKGRPRPRRDEDRCVDRGGLLTCDAFALSTTYTLDAAPDAKITLSAHSDKLNELLESDDESISNALSAWASKRSPYATSAAWDGEVYIDCNGKTVTTSFTLNDGASTLVQLRYDQTTKELSAL